MKRTFRTELACVFGIVFVAWGVVLMEKADFGMSMVVAPAYLLYRWLSPVWSFVTFGMAEYCLQAVLLLAIRLLLRHRRARGKMPCISLRRCAEKKLPRFVRRAAEAVK